MNKVNVFLCLVFIHHLHFYHVSRAEQGCPALKGYKVAVAFIDKIYRFEFEGYPIDLYKKLYDEAKIAEYFEPGHVKDRAQIVLGYNNDIYGVLFEVRNSPGTINSVRPDTFYSSEGIYECLEKFAKGWSHGARAHLFRKDVLDPKTFVNWKSRLDKITFFNGVFFFEKSKVDINTGETPIINNKQFYKDGEIFDIACGTSYPATNDENGQLIGVLEGKKIFRKTCIKKGQNAKGIDYGFSQDKHVAFDSSELNCFTVE